MTRLPRVDEYSSLAAPDGASLVNIPSDVKTVAYYVKSADGTAEPGSANFGRAATVSQGGTGLIRRQLARAVTKYANNGGNSQALSNTGDVVAPEVSAIEFRYFDGSAWANSWDSTETRSLPMAVEINLSIRPPPRGGAVKSGQSDPDLNYRLVVHLPVAQIPP